MTIFIPNGSTMDMGFLSEGGVLFHQDGIFTHSFHSKPLFSSQNISDSRHIKSLDTCMKH
jgi:hypothetical protein